MDQNPHIEGEGLDRALPLAAAIVPAEEGRIADVGQVGQEWMEDREHVEDYQYHIFARRPDIPTPDGGNLAQQAKVRTGVGLSTRNVEAAWDMYVRGVRYAMPGCTLAPYDIQHRLHVEQIMGLRTYSIVWTERRCPN